MMQVDNYSKLCDALNATDVTVRIAPMGDEENDIVFDYDEMTQELAMQIALMGEVPTIHAANTVMLTFSRTYEDADSLEEQIDRLEKCGFVVEFYNSHDWSEKF